MNGGKALADVVRDREQVSLSDPGRRSAVHRNVGLLLLRAYVVTILVIPSDAVFSPLGASGYVASMVALVAFAWNAMRVLGGMDRRIAPGNPLRAVLTLFWLITLASYLKFHLLPQDSVSTLAADRWLLLLLGITGVILVSGKALMSPDDLMVLLRTASWAGAFCGLVAGLQFWTSVDLAPILRQVPGLTVSAADFGIQLRGALNRVAGTAIHPIELGTTAALLLPLALHVLLFDKNRPTWRRLLPFLLIALSVPASVSRSGILAMSVSMGVYVLCQPPIRRLKGIMLVPVAVTAVFVSTPGLIGTLASFFEAGTSDPSISTRVGDYPFVEHLVSQRPLLGMGGGTFLPKDVFEILDNQYLKTSTELGLLGLVILIAYLLVPFFLALACWRRTRDPLMASASAACAGSAASAVASAFTFDAFSFPMFTGVHALVLGLCAACWTITHRGPRPLRRAAAGGTRPRATP